MFELLAMGGQPGGTEQDPRAGIANMIFMVVMVIVMFYFLLFRPQQKQRKEQEELLKNVKTGDKVLLNSGIFGIVSNVKDKSLMVKVADNVKIEVLKTAISSVVQKSAELEATAVASKN